jgi:hypothetical protein
VIIDNIAQLFDVQARLRLAAHASDTENDVGYQFWSFLKDWPTLSKEAKLEKYDRFACHEVNIFLYNKDRAFFDTVVHPFLGNKVQKDLVDLYLLGAHSELL